MLKKMEISNSDGGGVAWFGPHQKAYYKKNLTAAEVFKITETLQFPFVTHFRLKSSGGASPLLCHPFIMSKDSPLALEGSAERLLCHNGTQANFELYLSAANIEFPDDKSPVSDTRAIAAIASQNEKFLTKINGCYAVMDGKARKIRIYGDFKEKNGALHSNLFWEYKYTGNYQSSHSHYQGRQSWEENDWQNEGGSQGTLGVDQLKKDRKQKRREWWEAHVKKLKEKSEPPIIDLTENAGTFQLEEKTEKPPVLTSIHSEPPASSFIKGKEIIPNAA